MLGFSWNGIQPKKYASDEGLLYRMLLTNKFEALNAAPSGDIDTYWVFFGFFYSITSSITEAAHKTAGNDKSQRPLISSPCHKAATGEATANEKNETDVQHIEYTEICKAIRSRMSEDINNYNEEQLIKSLEDNKGIKTIKRKQCLGRSNIMSRPGQDDQEV